MRTVTETTIKERVRMALAEAGYPDATVHGDDDDPSIYLSGPTGVPDRVCYLAHRVARGETEATASVCWPCWNAERGEACEAGDCIGGAE